MSKQALVGRVVIWVGLVGFLALFAKELPGMVREIKIMRMVY